MSAFHYTALDAGGKQRKGILEGDNARQIRQKLRDQGLMPLDIHPIQETAKRGGGWLGGSKRKTINTTDLALITRQMATLIGASLPIEEVLTAVSEQTEKPQVKAILIGVRAKVMEGHPLAYGMDAFPRAFPHLYRSTIAAGEQSGHLDQILLQLADYIEKQNHITAKVRQALIYPALMTFVSLGIVAFLLSYVVPQIVGVFKDSNITLPFITVVLLTASDILRSYGVYALILLGAGIFGLTRLLKVERFRYRYHRLLLRIPIIGKNIKIINTARFSRTFGILFAATVPVLEALRAANELVALLPMRDAITHAVERVQEGISIHKALEQTGYFSPMSIHLIASGESSGQLEAMLTKAADTQDQEVTRLIEVSLTLFEPLMIVVMGGIVLFIVLAVLTPIFQLDVMAGQ